MPPQYKERQHEEPTPEIPLIMMSHEGRKKAPLVDCGFGQIIRDKEAEDQTVALLKLPASR